MGGIEGLSAEITKGAGGGGQEWRGGIGIINVDERMVSLLSDLQKVIETEGLSFGDRQRVSATEGVAVVFDQPEVVFFAEGNHRAKIEGIAEGVRHHDGFGFPGRIGGFELIHPDIPRRGVVVDEDGHGTDLQDRSDGRGKSSGAGDDFIAGLDAFVIRKLVGGER